ncbi:MAG: hypothetical protein WC731_05245 [Candidatus Omnitrophota bacterium]|jgi:hypothetical protein
MKTKSSRSFKIIAIIISFLLVFEQSGFAQVAGELDISRHFFALQNSFSQERFRPLHLRYLAYDPGANNFNLLLDKGDFVKGLSPKGAVPEQELKNQTKELLNYFFIGISLPNESFWVNLRPDAEDNIIDSELAETDVGKILLEADLQLKKDTANFTSPQAPEGKDYWDKLYKKAEELYGDENITIPTLTRPWIVPDEIIIRESSDNAYIYKATLKVMLEQDYLKNSSTYSFQDQRSKTLNEYSSQLIRETIIPKLTKEINSSKRYAPLRQVYYSLILAQWFKQKFYGKSGLYSYLIDRHKLDGLTSETPWSKTTYFNSYRTSFQQGEYNIKEPRYTPYGQTIRSYMSGGLDLGQIVSSAIIQGVVQGNKDYGPGSLISKHGLGFHFSGGTVSNPFGLKVDVVLPIDTDIPRAIGQLPVVGSPLSGNSPLLQKQASSRSLISKNNETNFLSRALKNLSALAGAVFVSGGRFKRGTLERILNGQGINLKIDVSIGDIADDFMELSAFTVFLIPKKILKECVSSLEFGANPSGAYTDADEPGLYSNEDKRVYIYQRSFAFWDAYLLARIILHEVGHGFEGGFSEEDAGKIKAAYSLIRQKISNGYKDYSLYLKHDDNILSLDNRKAIVTYTDKPDSSQFIAEFFREYILNGEELRDKIGSQKDSEVKEALATIYSIYKKRFNREYYPRDVKSLRGILERIPETVGKHIARDYKQFSEFRGVAGIFYLRYGLTLDEYSALAEKEGQDVALESLYKTIVSGLASKTQVEFEQWKLKLAATKQALYDKLISVLHDYAQAITSMHSGDIDDAGLQSILQDFRRVLLEIKTQSSPKSNEYILATEYAPIVFNVSLSALSQESRLPSLDDILSKQYQSAGSSLERGFRDLLGDYYWQELERLQVQGFNANDLNVSLMSSDKESAETIIKVFRKLDINAVFHAIKNDPKSFNLLLRKMLGSDKFIQYLKNTLESLDRDKYILNNAERFNQYMGIFDMFFPHDATLLQRIKFWFNKIQRLVNNWIRMLEKLAIANGNIAPLNLLWEYAQKADYKTQLEAVRKIRDLQGQFIKVYESGYRESEGSIVAQVSRKYFITLTSSLGIIEQMKANQEWLEKFNLAEIDKALSLIRKNFLGVIIDLVATGKKSANPMFILNRMELFKDVASLARNLEVLKKLQKDPKIEDETFLYLSFLPFEDLNKIIQRASLIFKDAGIVMRLNVSILDWLLKLNEDGFDNLTRNVDALSAGNEMFLLTLGSSDLEFLLNLEYEEAKTMGSIISRLGYGFGYNYFELVSNMLKNAKNSPGQKEEILSITAEDIQRWQDHNQEDFYQLNKIYRSLATSDNTVNLIVTVIKKKDISIIVPFETLESFGLYRQEMEPFNKFMNTSARYENKREIAVLFARWVSIISTADASFTESAMPAIKSAFEEYFNSDRRDKYAALRNSLEAVLEATIRKLLEEVTGEAIPQEKISRLEEGGRLQKIITVVSLYYSIIAKNEQSEADKKQMQERVTEILKKFISEEAAESDVEQWIIGSIEENRKAMDALLAAGYDKRLWEEGVRVEGEIRRGLGEEEKKAQINKQAQEIIDRAKKMGLPVKNIKIESYEDARDVFKTILDSKENIINSGRASNEDFEGHVNRIRDILGKIKDISGKYLNGRSEKAEIVIKKDFFAESLSGNNSYSGCFKAFAGFHQEMPLKHALEVNTAIGIVYIGGKPVANVVLALTDKGVVVYGDYKEDYDLGPLWAEAWKELAKLSPAVILGGNSAGRKASEKSGKIRNIFSFKAIKTATLWEHVSSDLGRTDENGDVYYIIQPALILTSRSIARSGSDKNDNSGKANLVIPKNQLSENEQEQQRVSPTDKFNKDRGRIVREIMANPELNELNLKPLLSNFERVIFDFDEQETEELAASLNSRLDAKRKITETEKSALTQKLAEIKRKYNSPSASSPIKAGESAGSAAEAFSSGLAVKDELIASVRGNSWRPVLPADSFAAKFIPLFNKLDQNSVPEEFPIVSVVDNGLQLPDSDKLCLQDKTTASRLKKEGIEFLSGELLGSNMFLKTLKAECAKEDSDLKRFLKQHFVYAMSPSLLWQGETNNSSIKYVQEMLGDNIIKKYPQTAKAFIPLIQSLFQKLPARQGINFFESVTGGTSCGNTRRALSGTVPLSKMLVYVYQLNSAMEGVYLKTNKNPEALGAFIDLGFDPPLYSSVEAISYALELLLAQWKNVGLKEGASMFFELGLRQALERTSDSPYRQYIFRFAALKESNWFARITDDFSSIDNNLTSEEWFGFAAREKEFSEFIDILAGNGYKFSRFDARELLMLSSKEGMKDFVADLISYGYRFKKEHITALLEMFGRREEIINKVKEIKTACPEFTYYIFDDATRLSYEPINVLADFLKRNRRAAVNMVNNLETALTYMNPEALLQAEKIREVCKAFNSPAFLISSFLSGSLNGLLSKFTGEDDFMRFALTADVIEKNFKKAFIAFLSGYKQGTQSQFDILMEIFLSSISDVERSSKIADIIGNWFSAADTTFSLPRDINAAMQSISSGNMDNRNPVHVFASYLAISKALQQEGMQRGVTYKDVLGLAEKRANRKEGFEGIPQEHMRNIEGVVYEAVIIRNKLLEIERAGKKQIVVANLSYGGVAVTPITEQKNGQAHIVGTQIPVWYTKVGSTEAHNNEYVLVYDLFTPEQIKVLIEEKPFVSVVDGSTSVADSDRSSPHIPDAFKGYRNYFIVLNFALSESFNPKDFDVNEEFVKSLLATDEAKELIRKIRSIAVKPRVPNAYKFGFSYERKADSEKEEFLYLREGKKEAAKATKLNVDEIIKQQNPFCIFIQSCIHPNDVDKKLMPEEYRAGYYDDRGHFKEFYLDYKDGYGVVISRRYADAAREFFMQFMSRDEADSAGSSVEQNKESGIDLSRRKGILISLATVLTLKILGPSKALAELLGSDEIYYLHLANSEPKNAVLDFKKYKAQPFAKNVLKAAINKNADVVLEHAEVFINETYAQELFELATQTWPQSILRHAYQIIKQPYAQGIIEIAASKYPTGALEYSFNYAKQPYAQKIIETAAKSEPVAALKFAKAYIEESYAKGILEQAAKKNYLATLEYSRNYFRKEYMRPIIEQCARKSAWGALRFASGYLNMPGARQLIEAAAELSPDTALRYSFEYMEAPYAKDIIIKSALQDPAAAIINTGGVGWVLEEKRKDIPEIDIILRIAASEYRGKQERIGALLDMIMNDIATGTEAGRAMYKANKISENDNEFFKELMKIKTNKSSRGVASVDRFLKRLSSILIRDMNDMHDLTAERRFSALSDYDASMLYTMIVYGEDEVYTSTFNGIFNILIKKMKGNNISGEKLLEMVGKNKFRVFIKLTAAFKRLNEFWDILEAKNKKDELIKEFVQGLAGIRIDNERLSQAIAVADTFSVINGGYQQVILREAIEEYKKMETAGNKEGVRIYGILISIFGRQLSIEEPWFQQMYQNYPVPDLTAIDGSQLFDPNGAQANTQVHFFYHDPYGKNSFANFKKLFNKNEIKESPDKSFIVIARQRADKKIIIYANNPYTDAVKGQMQIDKALKERGIEPQVVVHRGHSFHLSDTIERITAKAKIVFLGACGGYNYIVDVLERAPLAHIISTKGTGKNDVNNPLLDMLNNELLSGKGIQWEGFWGKAKKRLGNTKDFLDYVPPHRNLGVLFLKTYYNVAENVSKTIPQPRNQSFLREIIDGLTMEAILPITVFNMAINKIADRSPMDRREFFGLGKKTSQSGSADSSISREVMAGSSLRNPLPAAPASELQEGQENQNGMDRRTFLGALGGLAGLTFLLGLSDSGNAAGMPQENVQPEESAQKAVDWDKARGFIIDKLAEKYPEKKQAQDIKVAFGEYEKDKSKAYRQINKLLNSMAKEMDKEQRIGLNSNGWYTVYFIYIDGLYEEFGHKILFPFGRRFAFLDSKNNQGTRKVMEQVLEEEAATVKKVIGTLFGGLSLLGAGKFVYDKIIKPFFSRRFTRTLMDELRTINNVVFKDDGIEAGIEVYTQSVKIVMNTSAESVKIYRLQNSQEKITHDQRDSHRYYTNYGWQIERAIEDYILDKHDKDMLLSFMPVKLRDNEYYGYITNKLKLESLLKGIVKIISDFREYEYRDLAEIIALLQKEERVNQQLLINWLMAAQKQGRSLRSALDKLQELLKLLQGESSEAVAAGISLLIKHPYLRVSYLRVWLEDAAARGQDKAKLVGDLNNYYTITRALLRAGNYENEIAGMIQSVLTDNIEIRRHSLLSWLKAVKLHGKDAKMFLSELKKLALINKRFIEELETRRPRSGYGYEYKWFEDTLLSQSGKLLLALGGIYDSGYLNKLLPLYTGGYLSKSLGEKGYIYLERISSILEENINLIDSGSLLELKKREIGSNDRLQSLILAKVSVDPSFIQSITDNIKKEENPQVNNNLLRLLFSLEGADEAIHDILMNINPEEIARKTINNEYNWQWNLLELWPENEKSIARIMKKYPELLSKVFAIAKPLVSTYEDRPPYYKRHFPLIISAALSNSRELSVSADEFRDLFKILNNWRYRPECLGAISYAVLNNPSLFRELLTEDHIFDADYLLGVKIIPIELRMKLQRQFLESFKDAFRELRPEESSRMLAGMIKNIVIYGRVEAKDLDLLAVFPERQAVANTVFFCRELRKIGYDFNKYDYFTFGDFRFIHELAQQPDITAFLRKLRSYGFVFQDAYWGYHSNDRIGILSDIFNKREEYFSKIEAIRSVLPDFKYQPLLEGLSPESVLASLLERYPSQAVSMMNDPEGVLKAINPEAAPYAKKIREICTVFNFPVFLVSGFISGSLNNLLPGLTTPDDFIYSVFIENSVEQEFKDKFTAFLSGYTNGTQGQFNMLIQAFRSGLNGSRQSSQVAEVIGGWFCSAYTVFSLPKDISMAMQNISSGNMDNSDPVYVLANYLAISKALQREGMQRSVTYKDVLSLIEKRAGGSGAFEDIPEEHMRNIEGLVYEAVIIWNKLLETERAGKKQIVVANLSYGGVAVTPITEERSGKAYVVGTQIPVWHTKVGSTPAHNNEYVLVNDLFTPEQIKYLAEEMPFVSVVDGSTSIAASDRSSPHIPDAFKGYRNYFIVLNHALGESFDPKDFDVDEEFVKGLLATVEAQELIKKIQAMSIKPRAPNAYKFGFSYERKADSQKGEFLYLRVGKKEATEAKKLNIGEALKQDNPFCMFLQSCVHPDDVDKKLMPEEYKAGYYDDTNHFKEFYLDYEDGYGVVLSKRYAYAARELFRRFMLQKGINVMSGRFTTDAIRPIDTLVLDLDGTLTEAIGGNIENGTADIINYLLKKGVRIIIITDDILENVEKRIAKLDKSANLVVLTDGGARGDEGMFEQYNAQNIISPDLRSRVLGIAQANFPFGSWKEGKKDSLYRIQITDIQERTDFIKRFQDLLVQEGIEAKVYKVGRNSARVTIAHKEAAFAEAIKMFGIDVSKSLIIADSARSYRIDRKLLTAFPESVSVNIGKFSPSIESENQRIIQYAGQGTSATKMLLSSIAFRGGLPQHLLLSSMQNQPLEYMEAASSLTQSASLSLSNLFEPRQLSSAGSALEEVNLQKISAALGKMEKQAVDEKEIYGLAARLKEAFKWDDYFGNFTPEMWIELLRCKGVKELKGLDIKDGILIKQGDTVNDEQAMFLIEKGGVRVSEDAHGIWIADLEEGNYVGEIGAGSSNRLRTATVRIKEGAPETKFLAIPMSVFSALGLSRVFSEISRQRSNRLKSRERLAEKDYTRILKKYPDTEYDEDSPVTKAYNLALKIINPKENPLSVDVTYHNPYHWNELLDFIDIVLQGMGDNLKNKNRKIIFMLARVAAYLHDIGYYLSNDQGKFTVVGHEDRSKEFVRNNMKELGLSSRYVNAIQFMIEHTKLKIGEEFENKLGLINQALAEIHNGKLSDKTGVFLKEILPDLDLNLDSDLDFANDVLIAAKALAVADLYAATVDMVPFLWLEFTLEGSPAGKTTMLEQIAASRDFHKGVVEPQRLKLLLEGGFGLEKLIMDSGSLERLKNAREKNIGIMQQYAEAVKQIKASDTAESVKKTAETNLINLINGLNDDMVGPLKDELLAEVKTLVLKSSAVGAGSALQNPETGLIGSKTLGNYKFVLQGQGKEGYLLKIFGKRGVAGEIKFRLHDLPDGRKGIFVENVFANDTYREDFRKDFEKGIYSNMLKEIIEIGEQYSRDINKVTEITGAINNIETLQGLYGAIAGSRPTEEREEVERLSGIEKKNYYEHTEPLIKMLKKAIIEEVGSEEGRMELDRKLPDTLLVKARSGGGFSENHRMRVERDQIILISNTPVHSAGSSLEMRPEEAAKLIREAVQENYEKWGLLSERLKTARRILVRVPGRDNRGGHEFPLGEIAATLPILIKTLIISGESIEKIIVQCDSYPELVEALGENRVKLAEPSKTTDELRSIYSPDLVIDFDTVALGEEIPENTVKFPVAKLWMSLDRHREMREILTSAGLSIPKEGEAIIRRERERDGQTTIFVNPHSDSNKNDNVDLWVGLIQELVARGYKVVLNSGKEAGKDQAHSKNILEKLREEVRLGDVKEFKGSITDLLNTFSKKIDGVVTIDSGIFHVVHNLYSLPAVVFTTSNTLGWIPQEKEELLFKRVQYSDLKDSSTAVELLRSLLEREEKADASSPAAPGDSVVPQDSTSNLNVVLLSKIEDHMRTELKKIDDAIDREIEGMPFDDKPHRLSDKIMERYRLLFIEFCEIGRGIPEFDHLSYLMQDGKFTPAMAMNALQGLFLKENRLLVFSIGRDPVDGRIIENMPALSVFKVKETQLVTEDIIDKHVDALAIFVDGLIVQDYVTRRRMGFESYLAFAIHGVTIDGAIPVVVNKGSIAAELKRYYGMRLEMEATGQLPDFYRKNIPLLNEALAKLLIKQWPQPNKDISDFIAKHLDEYIRRIVLHELTHVRIAGTDDDEIFAYLVEIAQTPYSWLRLFDVVYSISPPVRSTSIEHDYASNNFLRNFIQGIFQKYEPGSLKGIPEDRHRAAATKLPDTYPAGLFMAISDIPEEVLKAEAKTKFLELKEKSSSSIISADKPASSEIQLDNTYDGLFNRLKNINGGEKEVNLGFSKDTARRLKIRITGWMNGLKTRKKEFDLFAANNQALSEEKSRKLNKFISGIANYVKTRRSLVSPQEPLAVAEKILFTTVGYGYPYAEIDITSLPSAVKFSTTILAKSYDDKFREIIDEAMDRIQRILKVLDKLAEEKLAEEKDIDLVLSGRSGQETVVVREETIRRIYNEISGASSSLVEDGKGGIDMRSLSQYTVIQPMTGSNFSKQGHSFSGTAPLPDKEWQEIERMANSGIAPSSERLREYLLSLQDPSSQTDKVLACIADILRQEEEKACCTESSLKEILALLESGKPDKELRLALTKIQVLAKEPQLIEQ